MGRIRRGAWRGLACAVSLIVLVALSITMTHGSLQAGPRDPAPASVKRIFSHLDPADVSSPTIPRILEVGNVTVSQADRDEWHRVILGKTFDEPVVVMGPASRNDAEPAVVQVANVGPSSFEFQMEEWAYLDGAHPTETISYLVIEAGSHTLANGTRVVADRIGAVGRWWKRQPLTGFSEGPVVVSQVASRSQLDPVVARLRSVDTDGFEIRLQEEEGNDGTRAREEVHWIALEPGVSASQFAVVRTANAVTHAPRTIDLGADIGPAPAILAAMQTYDGGDTAELRHQAPRGRQVDISIDEEQSRDAEVRHETETIGVVAVALDFGRPLPARASATFYPGSDRWSLLSIRDEPVG